MPPPPENSHGNRVTKISMDNNSSKRSGDDLHSGKLKEQRNRSRSPVQSNHDNNDADSSAMDFSTPGNDHPPIFNFLLTNADPKFSNPKHVLIQLQKYYPRANIQEIVFTRNGILIKSPDPNLARTILNKVSYTIFGPTANLQSLTPTTKKQQPPPRRSPTLSVVLKGVPLTYTDDEILDELRFECYEVKRVIRIMCKEGPTYLVRVLSDSKETIDDLLQNGAYIYRRRHRVEPSRTAAPIPLRCERCQAYNSHNTKDCPNAPICGHCNENHATSNCTNLQKPPSCNTCHKNHPTYSYKCLQKPEPIPEKPELTVPIRTTDTATAPTNSLKEPITVEDLLRFTTIVLQNVHPFLRHHILTQIDNTAKQLFGLHLSATYTGPYAHFSIQSISLNDSEWPAL